MYRRFFVLLFLVAAFSLKAFPQAAWSTFLDSSRATNWSSAGFTIPNYTTNCSVQPQLTANSSSAASANSTAIQNALASCNATNNVVNIPAGTYYIAGVTYPAHGQQVIRGAGPNSTHLISTTEAGCEGFNAGLCMIDASPVYTGSSDVLSGGAKQCLWTGGLTQGSTTITLSSCGGAPPNNQLIMLDQADDSSDTSGIYVCDETTPASCNYDGTGGSIGRIISGVNHSQVQVTHVTGVTSLGSGSYSVTISPGVYFTNVRSSQSPGAWWSGQTQLNGLENLSVDGTADSNSTVGMYNCYQCWVKNVTLLNGARSSVYMRQSGFDVIRDSYFYQAQGHQSVSYNIESSIASGFLIENNIMQQTTEPIMFNGGTGGVIDYNFGIDNIAFSNYVWGAFSSHAAGDSFNLWEGNNWAFIESDDAWGSSSQQTYFRNSLTGWQNNRTQGSTPIIHRSYSRAYNIVGNILGQPGYHTQYQIGATGNTTFTGTSGQNESVSIYTLGLTFDTACGTGTVRSSPFCDPLSVSTLMRWANYDVVNAAVRFNSTEAAPAAVTFAAANFTTSYFNTLSHTLPASLYYASTPSWWPSGKAWPVIGPDVSTGNVGICTGGTYAGTQAISSGQCTGGSLSTAWASHIASIPAQDCFLNVMGGKPDGTGSVLNFDASQCYASSGNGTGPAPPTALVGTVN
jgi:hypothetical protein